MNEWERVLALLLDKSKELSPKTKKKRKFRITKPDYLPYRPTQQH